MSSLPRDTKLTISYLLSQVLREGAKREGEDPDEVIQFSEFTIDNDFARCAYKIRLTYRNEVIRDWCVDYDAFFDMAGERKAVEHVVSVMRDNLSIAGQMHFVRLNKIFPGTIKDVKIEVVPELASRRIYVHFKNGHVADALEHESKSDLFIAKCAMLFDLPPL